MRYESYKAECALHHDRERVLREITVRDWFLGDIFVRIDAGMYSDGINVNVSTLSINEDACTVVAEYVVKGAYFDWQSEPIRRLTADQLRRVAICREVFEDWVAGKTDGLLVPPPSRACVPPPPGVVIEPA